MFINVLLFNQAYALNEAVEDVGVQHQAFVAHPVLVVNSDKETVVNDFVFQKEVAVVFQDFHEVCPVALVQIDFELVVERIEVFFGNGIVAENKSYSDFVVLLYREPLRS